MYQVPHTIRHISYTILYILYHLLYFMCYTNADTTKDTWYQSRCQEGYNIYTNRANAPNRKLIVVLFGSLRWPQQTHVNIDFAVDLSRPF